MTLKEEHRLKIFENRKSEENICAEEGSKCRSLENTS
jgi:hypothetical protein